MAFNTLKGFNSSNGATSAITNADVVKYDIMNEINTLKGSYLGKPEYGTDIQNMVFEQMTETNIQTIEDSIRDVFDRDGRAALKGLTVDEDGNTITVNVYFFYVNNFIVDNLSLTYDASNQ